MKNFKLSDGKKVIFKSKKNLPKMSWVKQTYSKLPDDPKVPLVFQTKKQYVKYYLKNQEKKRGIDFTKPEEVEYMKNELARMTGVVSRYTTKSNPYAKPMTVIFTDQPMNKNEFQNYAKHEVGHEIYERNPKCAKRWNLNTNPKNSPSMYGRIDHEEDFAESYVMYDNGQLRSNKRKRIIKDTISNDLSKRAKLANSASLYRSYSDEYDKDTLALPYGHSQNINLKYKWLKEDPNNNELRKDVTEEINFRKSLKDDLLLTTGEINIFKNMRNSNINIEEDDDSKNRLKTNKLFRERLNEIPINVRADDQKQADQTYLQAQGIFKKHPGLIKKIEQRGNIPIVFTQDYLYDNENEISDGLHGSILKDNVMEKDEKRVIFLHTNKPDERIKKPHKVVTLFHELEHENQTLNDKNFDTTFNKELEQKYEDRQSEIQATLQSYKDYGDITPSEKHRNYLENAGKYEAGIITEEEFNRLKPDKKEFQEDKEEITNQSFREFYRDV